MTKIAILRDGFSDYLVIKKFITIIFNKHKNEKLSEINFLELDTLSLRDSIDQYLGKVSKTQNYSYHSEEAKHLIDSLISVFYACYGRCNKEFEFLNDRIIIIVNTDAEKLLMRNSNYFTEWAYNLKGIIYYSIEKFYDGMNSNGYSYNLMPYFIPLIPFPSSEIIVAACMLDSKNERFREMPATPDLKQRVYESDSIDKVIQSGHLNNVLDTFLTKENIDEIYKEMPEARMLIHSFTI